MNNNAVPVPILGKILGGIIGAVFFGPVGLIIGVIVGHLLDRRTASFLPFNKVERRLLLDATFKLLGCVAKADGRVSTEEIKFTQQVMARMRMTDTQRVDAMRKFYEGKKPAFDLDALLQQMRQGIPSHHRAMLNRLLNMLVQMAYVNGGIEPEVKAKLQYIAAELKLSTINFSYYDAIFSWQERYQRAWQHRHEGQSYQQSHTHRAPSFGYIGAAYKILGVSEKSSVAEVKKAYRRKMSQYHPDKLMSKGLSEKEMAAATERVQRIKAAYEQIRQDRGF